MEKKNITLSAISVDVEIQPDNTLDAYISTEGSSGHIIRTCPLRP